MFENLSKEELIKLLQSKNKENSELQEKLKLKDDELQQKSEELQQTNDELQQKSEELQLASDELQQTQTELESIKSFCAENHQKVVQLIVNSKVRLESYSNSDLYPDSCDYEQFLAFEFRLVKSLIANNLRLSGLHAKQFVPSSEKMGYPGNTKKNNEPENEPAESVGTISKDTSPEEGSGPKQAAEYLSKEEQAYNVAVGAVKTIESELNKTGRKLNRIFSDDPEKNNKGEVSKPKASEGNPNRRTSRVNAPVPPSTKNNACAADGYKRLAEFMNVCNHLKIKEPLNKNFNPDNRCSKNQNENSLNLGAEEVAVGGSLSSSNGSIVYCPICRRYEEAEVIHNGNENDHMMNISRYRLELIERLVRKFKCKKCGSIISDKLTPDSSKTVFDENKSVESDKVDASLSETLSAQSDLSEAEIMEQQEQDVKLQENLLNTLASESKLVQKNQQLLEENSRLSAKQFAYCDIGMMLPADFNLKTATMFPVITGGKLTLGTVATFIFEHNFNNMPYSRIFSNFKHSGLKRSTAFAAIKAFDRLVLHKEAEIIRDEILKSHIIHADESQVHVRAADSEGRENRQFTCWQFCNSHLDEARYAWYDINESRSQDVPYNILKDADISKSVVVTDGNQTYDKVLKELSATHAYCYAHLRRAVLDDLTDMKLKDLFQELISDCSCYEDVSKKFPEFGKKHEISDEEGLMMALFFNINCLFALEHDLDITQDDYLEQVKEIRTSHSSFFINNIEKIVEELAKKSVHVIERNGIKTYKSNKQEVYGNSIAYALKRLEGLKQFLSDPEIPLTNSLCERGFRDFAVAKHGFYFIDSIDGTHSFADQMTICRSCINNGVDPHNYMIWLGWNVYQRYMTKYPTGRITSPSPQYIPAKEIPDDEISRYKIRTDIKDLPAGEYAEIGIYDKRYQAITDNIDFTGLGILDYKKLCLKDRL